MLFLFQNIKNEITDAIEKYFNAYFKVEQKDDNYFAIVSKILEKEDGYRIDYKCFNEFIKEFILPEINNLGVEEVNKKNDVKYYGITVKVKKYTPQFTPYLMLNMVKVTKTCIKFLIKP